MILKSSYRILKSTTPQVIPPGSSVSLLSYDFNGFLGSLYIRGESKDLSVILQVDGSKLYELNFGDLKDIYDLKEDSRSSDFTGIGTDMSGKKFFDRYNPPSYVFQNIVVKVKNTDTKPRSVLAYMVKILEVQ